MYHMLNSSRARGRRAGGADPRRRAAGRVDGRPERPGKLAREFQLTRAADNGLDWVAGPTLFLTDDESDRPRPERSGAQSASRRLREALEAPAASLLRPGQRRGVQTVASQTAQPQKEIVMSHTSPRNRLHKLSGRADEGNVRVSSAISTPAATSSRCSRTC
jgi:hypothetical protein